MNATIRRSTLNDLNLLENIEKSTFQPFQQCPRRTLRLSLNSPFQRVWFAEINLGKSKKEVGSLTVHMHKRTLRVFSIAVLPEYQGTGVGISLLKYVENFAISHGFERISLEVDVDNASLISWYNRSGYHSTELIEDYYEEGRDALRMVFELPQISDINRVTNIIVVDKPKRWNLNINHVKVISAKDYTSDSDFFSRKNLRVFNLCSSYKYQTLGYYVSLLASAREHRVIPSVTTIRDMKDTSVIRSITDDIDEIIQKSLQKISGDKLELDIYFGQTIDASFKNLGQKIYQLFEAPLFRVYFSKSTKWEIIKIIPKSLDKVDASDFENIQLFAKKYFETKRFHRKRMKPYKYDLAILVNPNEEHPPSDKKALKLFNDIAEDLDFYTEYIHKDDLNRLSEFDALFIRETTNVNNYTYQFARKAYAEGLVVIDDPWSILRCSNKIYLNERLRINNLNTPETHVFFKGELKKKLLESIVYPIILKQPDSAFSIGVLKVNNEIELKENLNALFKKSELVIGQAFLPSDYDWRIGVLDNQPLFACKYYMAKGHWQIYDWKSDEKDPSGDFETLPLSEVPKKVIQAATKAASLMGDGLYGVDLKEVKGKVYVIEVNDNPNIDAGIEDKILGKELYLRIMQSFLTRIEMSRNIARFVSVEPD
tara:strand:+ start:43256 stop:45220 length:1965 start_codon:yes stop_codon:yes gene_type:complete